MRPRIIVSRTDRIGDLVLTLPLCGLLRARLDAEVVVLARGYTTAVAESSDAVTTVLDWDTVASADRRAQARFLGEIRADAIVHAFPRRAVASAARNADIRQRIGTSHRWYHWLTCTSLVGQGRHASSEHEARRNVQLARDLLGQTDYSLADLAAAGRIKARGAPPETITRRIDPACINVAFQITSGGSAKEWPLHRWRELVGLLNPSTYRVFVLGTAPERALIAPLLDEGRAHVVDATGLGLRELIATLAQLDGIVSVSTGPLQLGSALSINALGLISPTPAFHHTRWAPIGQAADIIVAERCRACAAGKAPCTCMENISARQVADRIARWPQSAQRAREPHA